MLKIWMNTKTLDGLINDLSITDSKEEADIALLGSKPIDLVDFPNLKGVFRAGVSRDNVPVKEAKKKGIKVAFPSSATVEYIFEETADFACYLILKMVYNNIGTISPWVKNGRVALQDKKLLVIGTGNIGKKVVTKMSSFMHVMTYDIISNTQDQLKQYLQEADVVSLHIPSNPENSGFLGSEYLSLIKDGGILVNTGRGALVSEKALYNELLNKRLFVAFDVYWQEPYEGKLKEFHPDYFFMTPHVASTCDGFLKGSANDLRNLIKEIEND
jgi:phosphoglycerate dehydrogenase-like enzyme